MEKAEDYEANQNLISTDSIVSLTHGLGYPCAISKIKSEAFTNL